MAQAHARWFAVVLGCLHIALAFRLKKLKQTA